MPWKRALLRTQMFSQNTDIFSCYVAFQSSRRSLSWSTLKFSAQVQLKAHYNFLTILSVLCIEKNIRPSSLVAGLSIKGRANTNNCLTPGPWIWVVLANWFLIHHTHHYSSAWRIKLNRPSTTPLRWTITPPPSNYKYFSRQFSVLFPSFWAVWFSLLCSEMADTA